MSDGFGVILSLSARRAWIEIPLHDKDVNPDGVALRKESVDRNLYYGDDLTFADGSLSARRAWIEITSCRRVSGRALSLSARRAWIEIEKRSRGGYITKSRSPQGERG